MRRNKVLVILGFALFAAGAVVAVLGVQASRSADDDLVVAEQDLADAEERLDAVESDAEAAEAALEAARAGSSDSLDAGREVVAAGEDLGDYDRRLVRLSEQERQAILEARFERFNQVNDELSRWLAESNLALETIRASIDRIQPL